jgi:hypothetical protein
MKVRLSRRAPAALLLVALLALAVSIDLNGCTILGTMAGSSADRSVPPKDPGYLLQVKPGTRVTLWMASGQRIEGVFSKVEIPPDSVTRADSAWVAAADTSDTSATSTPKIPRGARILMNHPASYRPMAIAADSVEKVHIVGKGGATVGFLLGAAADVLIISSLSDGGGCEGGGGCSPDCEY